MYIYGKRFLDGNTLDAGRDLVSATWRVHLVVNQHTS